MTKHKIDISRPQDYMFKNVSDSEITSFTKSDGSSFPINVHYVSKNKNRFTVPVTDEGFYWEDKQASDFDVILRPGLVAFEAAPEVKRRKVVQISTCYSSGEAVDHGKTPLIYALCDDGTVFFMAEICNSNFPTDWIKLPEIPQD